MLGELRPRFVGRLSDCELISASSLLESRIPVSGATEEEDGVAIALVIGDGAVMALIVKFKIRRRDIAADSESDDRDFFDGGRAHNIMVVEHLVLMEF